MKRGATLRFVKYINKKFNWTPLVGNNLEYYPRFLTRALSRPILGACRLGSSLWRPTEGDVERAMTKLLSNDDGGTVYRVTIAFLLLMFVSVSSGAEPFAWKPNEDLFVTSQRPDATSLLDGTTSIGRVTRIDATAIESEDRLKGVKSRFERPNGGGILLKPHSDLLEVEKRIRSIRDHRGFRDHVWLRNGDEFSCDFFSLDKRFARLRAFDVDVVIPRGRVLAIRFRDVAEVDLNDTPVQ